MLTMTEKVIMKVCMSCYIAMDSIRYVWKLLNLLFTILYYTSAFSLMDLITVISSIFKYLIVE